MKKLMFILCLGLFACCDNGPLKTYRVALTDVNGKIDTVNYYLHDENYEIDEKGSMLTLRGGCLCKQSGATGHQDIVCGIKDYKLISITPTPKSVELLITKQNKSLDQK